MHGQRITSKLVDAAQAQGRDYVLWDRDLKGFGVKVTRAGTKTYVVQYRMGGRGCGTKRWTIGRDGSPWTAAKARDEAERILHRVGLGEDPVAVDNARRDAQLNDRFEQFAEHFLEAYAKRNWAPRTYSIHKSNVDRWLLPVLGSKPLALLGRKEISAVLDRIPSDRTALPRNVFVLMRTMFNWAVERGQLDKSPMLGMKPPRAAPERHHILADHELLAVAAYAPRLGPVWGNLVHMLILTGQRLREVAEADWSEFDRDKRLWTIPRARTKNSRDHVVPLNEGAIATLDECAGVDAADDDKVWPMAGFVFSHLPGRPVSGFSKMKARLDTGLGAAADTEIRPWRLHDLRRTVATNMQRLGVRFEVTEAILNHVSVTQAGVASVYQRHDWLEEKRAALDAWGEKVVSIIEQWQAQQNTARKPRAGQGSRKSRSPGRAQLDS